MDVHMYECMDLCIQVYMFVGTHAWAFICVCMSINTHITYIHM